MNKKIVNIKVFSVVLIVLFSITINLEKSMANPKNEIVNLELSNKSISFNSPVNYSKDFPRTLEFKYRINMYDNDLYKSHYTDLDNSYAIRQSHWDYGRSFLFGRVNGTLSMGLVLYKVTDAQLNLTKKNDFLKALKKDFESAFDEKTREESGVDLPEVYSVKNISGNEWGGYEYFIDGGRHVVYAHWLDENHYLMVSFNFINNSEGKKNNWKEQAQSTVDFIMSSFKLSD